MFRSWSEITATAAAASAATTGNGNSAETLDAELLRGVLRGVRAAIGLPQIAGDMSSSSSSSSSRSGRVGWLEVPAEHIDDDEDTHKGKSNDEGAEGVGIHPWELFWLQSSQIHQMQSYLADSLLVARLTTGANLASGSGNGIGAGASEAEAAAGEANQWYAAAARHQVNNAHRVEPSVRVEMCFDRVVHALAESLRDGMDPGSSTSSDKMMTTATTVTITQKSYMALQRALADSQCLSQDQSLLPAMFFPMEQVASIYAPYWVPCLIPILRACVRIYRAARNKEV